MTTRQNHDTQQSSYCQDNDNDALSSLSFFLCETKRVKKIHLYITAVHAVASHPFHLSLNSKEKLNLLKSSTPPAFSKSSRFSFSS